MNYTPAICGSACSGSVSWGEAVEYINGISDLVAVGAGLTYVEQRYQLLTEGPAVETQRLGTPLVKRPDETWCELLEHRSTIEDIDENCKERRLRDEYPDHYYPARSLPSDATLVIRTSALQEFEADLSEPETTSQRLLGRRERDSLLVIIAALAKLARIDVSKPSSAATSIESQTELMGARVAARTIENHLRRIPEALEAKGQN